MGKQRKTWKNTEKQGESEENIKKTRKNIGKQGKTWNNTEKQGETRKNSLNFIRLLRVVITPSVTSESTGR